MAGAATIQGEKAAARGQFLKDYLAMIADLSSTQDSHLWWATDFSSKNRFTTDTLDRIQRKLKGEVNPTTYWQRLSRILKALARWPYFALQLIMRVLWIRFRLHTKVSEIFYQNDSFYVIKSFAYPASFKKDGTYSDAFFGVLPAFIRRHEQAMVVVGIPTNFFACVEGIRRTSGCEVVPWEYFLRLRDIIIYAWKGLTYRPRAVEKVMMGAVDVTEVVAPDFRFGQLKIQPFQLYHYPATLELCRKIKVKAYVLTFESNPWEKMCILALQKMAPQARLIGYQHNVVPQASLNMFIDRQEIGKTPLPDVILSTGDEPRRILERFGAYPSGMVRTACALRIEPFEDKPVTRRQIKNVLVALEGVDAAHHLARYAIDQLSAHPEYCVKFRTHPVLPWSYFRSKYGYDLSAHGHFSVSAGTSLKADIEEADVVLYWGSTVGMEALGLGRPVIHFDNGSLLSFDPLFESSALKWVATSFDKLCEVFRSIDGLSDKEFQERKSTAVKYLNNYFHRATEEKLRLFLASN